MPRPHIQRGEIWVVDLGYLGKVRPALVMSLPFEAHERTLCIIVPHTTSVIGTRFEIRISHPALQAGVFDVQQTSAVQAAKFVRRLGAVAPAQMHLIEKTLAELLGLRLA